MADEKKTESSGLTGAVPITAVIALVASLVITNSSPFNDDRPQGVPLKSQQYQGAQDIDARLWEDPLVALDNKVPVDDNSHTPEQIYKDNPTSPGDQVTVVAVTLPGSPYQEAAESRMRWRYAILSALANQNYIPMDEQHIGYFQALYNSSDNNSQLSAKVAFEWWSQDKDNTKKILLLWVNESGLSKNPAATLKRILCQTNPTNININKSPSFPLNSASLDSNSSTLLRDSLKEVLDNNQSNIEVISTIPQTCFSAATTDVGFKYAVLGPNSSTLLSDMLKEVKDNKDNDFGEISTNTPITYYSATATASDESLLQKVLPKEAVNGKTVQAYLQLADSAPTKHKHGITLHRTTATDAEMMNAMLDELTILHRIKKTNHVVILSEWDTFYGRSISEAFKTAWALKNYSQDIDQVVHKLSYMRGLDGKLPDKSEKEKSEKQADSAEKKSDTKEQDKLEAAKALELPEGRNQKDYLRRLSEYIHDLDHKIIDEGDWKGITAIGVLGSDVRDKLMILEALRIYFPHKLFFTTDLDAAYYHPSKWHQTHNLLVASAFDLKLRPELQGQIPPFRDSYQTALFSATQIMVNDIEIAEPNQKMLAMTDFQTRLIKTPPPLLFEIGRHSPIRLKPKKDIAESDLENSTCLWEKVGLECKNIQPPYVNPQSNLTSKDVGMLILSFSIGTVFLFFVSSRFREGSKLAYSTFKERPWFTTVALIAGIFICWKIGTFMIQDSTEPFYWLEGVSIWPSQLLRLSVILFAGIFFYWGYHHIRKDYKKNPLISILTTYVNASPLKLSSMLLIENETSERISNNRSKSSLISIISSPIKPNHKSLWDIFFIGDWKPVDVPDDESKVNPEAIWSQYTEYFEWHKPIISCQWVWRIIIHVVVFFVAAALLILLTGIPNVPARDVVAIFANMAIIVVAVFCTLFLTIWVVENARLCKQLIEHLSKKPSLWHKEAIEWATETKNVANDCVHEWLDIYLVTQLTKIMQPLIWGPIGCIALMLLARSPATDDWDLPLGLDIIFAFMLFYAIFAEVFLQRGAQQTRTKVIDQLTDRIRKKRNDGEENEWDIKRIEVEIERIKDLREGAFLPWYQLPVLQSFGGLSSLWLVLQYIASSFDKGGLL